MRRLGGVLCEKDTAHSGVRRISFLLLAGFICPFCLSNHLGDIVHRVFIQSFMPVFGIIALSHFKLLHKADHSHQAEFTGKRRQASDTDLLKGHHLCIHCTQLSR